MKRRTFLKTVGAVAGGVATGIRPVFADPTDAARKLIPDASGLPRRTLGRTGRNVSIIVFPGLSLTREGQSGCTAALHRAFDGGVNYFDVAPSYGNGDAENKMGAGLQGIDRSRYFLSCKTRERDAAGARRELEQSLRRLKTDHFDLYQLHAVTTLAEARRILAPGGALETFLAAREEGKVRWLGFSSHSIEAGLTLLRGHKFDTVMHPVNFIEHFSHNFDQSVLARAQADGAGVIAIKPMSAGAWRPGEQRHRQHWYRTLEEPDDIALALRFTLSLEPVVAGVPPAFIDLADKAIAAAKKYQPATEADVNAIRALAAKYAPIFSDAGRIAAASPYGDGVPGLFA